MPWTPLSTRSTRLQGLLGQCADDASVSADDLYNNSELGLLSDDDLESWLQERLKSAADSSPLPLPALRDGDSYQAETLGWLQDNAYSPEDKAWATKEYRKNLFQLWRKYVADTGETWYPPLLNDLKDHYKARIDHDDSSI
jgi:hypothetical protein